MKKILKKIATFLILGIITTITCANTVFAFNANDWLPKFGDGEGTTVKPFASKLEQYEALPEPSLNSLFITAIRTILFIAGVLVTIGLIVAGIFYLTSAGNEEGQTKAKKILVYLGIGIIVISVSYALVSGVMQINLFK